MSAVRGNGETKGASIDQTGASSDDQIQLLLRRQQKQFQLAKKAAINFSQSMQITKRTLEVKPETEKKLFYIDMVNIIEDMVDAAGIVAAVHQGVVDRILQRPEAEIATQQIEEEIKKRIANSIREKRTEDLEAIAKQIKDDPAFITDHVYIQAFVRAAIANVAMCRLYNQSMLARKSYIEGVCRLKLESDADRRTTLKKINQFTEEAEGLLAQAETKLEDVALTFQKIRAEVTSEARVSLGSDVQKLVRKTARIEAKCRAVSRAVKGCKKAIMEGIALSDRDRSVMVRFANAVLLEDAIIKPARIVRNQIEAIAADVRAHFKAQQQHQQQQPAPITPQEADKIIRELHKTMLADAKAAKAAAERAYQAGKALRGQTMNTVKQMEKQADALSMVQTKPYPALCSLSEGVARTSRFILRGRPEYAMMKHGEVAQQAATWATNTSAIDYSKPIPNETPASQVESAQVAAERVKENKQAAENAASEAEKILQDIKQKVEVNQQTMQEISEKLEKAEAERYAKIAAQLASQSEPKVELPKPAPAPEPQQQPQEPQEPQEPKPEPEPKEGVAPKPKQPKPRPPKVKIEAIVKVHPKPPTHLQKYGKRYLSLLMGILIAVLVFTLLFTLSHLALPVIIGITIGAGLPASLMTALGCTLFKGSAQKDKALKGDKKDPNAPVAEGSTYQALKTLRIDPLATNNTETLNVWRAPQSQPTRKYANDNVTEPIQDKVNSYRPSMT